MEAGRSRALVVEDDRAWQEILSELLDDVELDVDRAAGYDEAERRLRHTAYRLAVVDLSLAYQDHEDQQGLRVLEAIHRYAPGCTAILLTGFATVELAVAAMLDYGAYACLRKEIFRRGPFLAMVQRILAGSAPAPEWAERSANSAGLGVRPGVPVGIPPGDEVLPTLTPREREVLELLVLGLPNKSIASTMIVSPNTVKRYLKSIFRKLQVDSRAAAVAKAVSAGMTPAAGGTGRKQEP